MTRYELIIYWSKDDDCFAVEIDRSQAPKIRALQPERETSAAAEQINEG